MGAGPRIAVQPRTGGAEASISTRSQAALCASSRSAAAGPEYSGRNGPRVYTQFFVVPPTVLARFANNPFALLHAARVQGR